jgi:short-subunit dehydrogenase
MDRRLALVTGASAGIGAVFARRLAAKGCDLALTARRRDRLEALAAELSGRHGVRTFVAPADLAAPEGPQTLLDQLAAADLRPDILVNNAGYGLPGAFASTTWEAQEAQLQLLAVAPCELAHKLLPDMVARRFGRIVNVASLAALAPGVAGHTLYAAAKSLLVKFSESLNLEMRRHGVHVTALCPGFTYSEFHDVNGMRARITAATPRWAWMAAEPVVEAGWRAVEANRPICVPGLVNKALAVLSQLVPERLALEIRATAIARREAEYLR